MSTKIEWVRNPDGTKGETWNPVTGCTKTSPGCTHCFAERMARRLAGRYGYPEAPNHFDVTLHPERLEQPLWWKKPRMIFVCSMGDLFHEDVPTPFIIDVWRTMRDAPQHTFQILTKRPYPMLSIITDLDIVLPNVWLGVSVESPDYLWRVDELMKCPATVRFVNLEPLLAAVDLGFGPSQDCLWCGGQGWWVPVGGGRPSVICQCITRNKYLNWVIVGGESGPGARPMHPQWARDIRDQCQAAGVPFFMKQMAKRAPIPDDLMIREFPERR